MSSRGGSAVFDINYLTNKTKLPFQPITISTSPVDLAQITKHRLLMEDEIETNIATSKDRKLMVIELKSINKLTLGAVILELEYLINELAKAEDEKTRPAFKEH